jgi:hypothetical protein
MMQGSSNLHVGFQSQETQVFDTRPTPPPAPALGKVRCILGMLLFKYTCTSTQLGSAVAVPW